MTGLVKCIHYLLVQVVYAAIVIFACTVCTIKLIVRKVGNWLWINGL